MDESTLTACQPHSTMPNILAHSPKIKGAYAIVLGRLGRRVEVADLSTHQLQHAEALFSAAVRRDA